MFSLVIWIIRMTIIRTFDKEINNLFFEIHFLASFCGADLNGRESDTCNENFIKNNSHKILFRASNNLK